MSTVLKTVSLKLYPEVADRFEALSQQAEAATKGAFLETLLENYENPRKQTVKDPDDAHTIFRLQGEADLQTETIRKLQEELQKAHEAIESMEAQPPVEKIVEVEKQLAEGEFAVKPHPFVMHLIDDCCKLQTQKTGKQVTPSRFLQELFWNHMQNPRANHLPRIYTASELAALQKKFTEKQPADV